MRLLSTLYIDDHDVRVHARKDSLEIRRDGSLDTRYPMQGLEAVVITGRAEMTTAAIGRCAEHGIRVTALKRGGGMRFSTRPPTSGNVLLRLNQYRCSEDIACSLDLARMFVAGKLQNQRRSLNRWAANAGDNLKKRIVMDQHARVSARLERLSTAVDGDTLRGLEGDATRAYFKAMAAHLGQAGGPALAFAQRTRRPPRDPPNARLCYLYGLLAGQAMGALDSIGLDLQVGFLHRPRPGRPALALDLMEEFRPALSDRFAVSVIKRRQVRPEHFEETPGGAVYLTRAGRRLTLELYERYRSETVRHPLQAGTYRGLGSSLFKPLCLHAICAAISPPTRRM